VRSPPGGGFYDDKVDPNREPGNKRTVGQRGQLVQAANGGPQVRPLAPVEGLLAQTECPARPPANLDDDQAADESAPPEPAPTPGRGRNSGLVPWHATLAAVEGVGRGAPFKGRHTTLCYTPPRPNGA